MERNVKSLHLNLIKFSVEIVVSCEKNTCTLSYPLAILKQEGDITSKETLPSFGCIIEGDI